MNSINFANLPQYVNQLNFDVVREAVLKSSLFTRVPVISGVKVPTYINGIESTPKLVAVGCDTDFVGLTNSYTPIKNILTPWHVQLPETICKDEIDDTFYAMKAKSGAGNRDITQEFVDVYLQDKAEKFPLLLSTDAILASTNGTFSSVASTLGGGLLYQLKYGTSAASTINYATASTYSPTTAVDIVDAIVQKMVTSAPSMTMKNDNELWMSVADYITYFQGLRNKDWFAWNIFDQAGNMIMEMPYPGGAKVKIVAMPELNSVTNGKHYFILSYASNYRLAEDGINDPSSYEFWFDQNKRAHRYRAEARIALNVAYNKYVILGESN